MSNCTCLDEPWGRYAASGGVFSRANGTDLSLYSFGGDTYADADAQGGVIRTNWKFSLMNTSTSSRGSDECACWEQLANSPLPLGYRATATQVASQPDSVFVLGGADVDRVAVDSIYQYSLSQDTWTLLDSVLPTPRWKHAAVAIDEDRILVTGGRQGETVLADVWIFDTWNLSWTFVNVSLPPMYRHGMAYDADRNFVWIHGGLDDKLDRYENQLWQLRLSSQTLRYIPLDNDFNPPRMASHVMEYLSEPDVLIFWGGNCGDDAELHVYDIQENTWCRIAPASRPNRRDGMIGSLRYPHLYMAQGDLICYNQQVLAIADVHVLDLTDLQAWEMLYEPYNARGTGEEPYCDGSNAGNCQPLPWLNGTKKGTSTCSADLLAKFTPTTEAMSMVTKSSSMLLVEPKAITSGCHGPAFPMLALAVSLLLVPVLVKWRV